MSSIAHLKRTLKHLFTHDAVILAQQAGMRERTLSFSHLAMLLVVNWVKCGPILS